MLQNNWRWAKLGEISDVIMGQSPSGDETTDNPAYIPLIGGAADMGELLPIVTRYTKVPTKLSQADDVIICVRATLGRPIYSDGEYCLGRGVAAIRSNILTKEFIRYYLLRNEQYLYDNAAGSTFLQITSTKLRDMPIPVPPLDEQQRIVDIIESLFSKLDKAKVLAQNIIDNYELRRSAILRKMFDNSYVKVKLSKILSVSKETTTDFSKPNLKYIGLENMRKNYGIISYENAEKIKSPKNIFRTGQILYGKLRPYLNKHDIAKFDGVCSTDIMVLDNIEELAEKKYINYYFDYDKFIDYITYNSKGITLPRVTKDILLNAECPLPTKEEQKEIVRILDNLLSKEQQTKELAEQVLQKIDLMNKVILLKVFNGKLF